MSITADMYTHTLVKLSVIIYMCVCTWGHTNIDTEVHQPNWYGQQNGDQTRLGEVVMESECICSGVLSVFPQQGSSRGFTMNKHTNIY